MSAYARIYIAIARLLPPLMLTCAGAALAQDAVGEDVAALEIGSDLDLVDGHERDVEIARHRLNSRHPIGRGGRSNFFLARN